MFNKQEETSKMPQEDRATIKQIRSQCQFDLTQSNHYDNHQPSTPTRPQSKLGLWTLMLVVLMLAISVDLRSSKVAMIQPVSGHIVLTRDDRGSSLVLTGEDGKGGKGKGKGGGDQLVIAGSGMGENGQNTNMVLQDASNREGDVVIQGNSMIVPGEDGHIVLADSRSKNGGGSGGMPQGPAFNPLIFWLPYMNSRSSMYRMMPFFGGAFGGAFG